MRPTICHSKMGTLAQRVIPGAPHRIRTYSTGALGSEGMGAMQLGPLYDFRNPKRWERPPAQLHAELLEQIVYAAQLGFDSVWVTEHHFVEDGYTPSS